MIKMNNKPVLCNQLVLWIDSMKMDATEQILLAIQSLN
jgi:hypothetical protein